MKEREATPKRAAISCCSAAFHHVKCCDAKSCSSLADISVLGRVSAEFAEILIEEALDFVADLHRRFEPRRQDLLARRAARQKEFDRGKLPDFLPDTRKTRTEEWRVAPQPKDLLDRRVELTGPTDRKMVINALNSGASTFMADFEDANCPTWHNMVDGQINLRDAVRRTISFEQSGKRYRLQDRTAVLIPRPRGWHLDEKHCTSTARPYPARCSTSGCSCSTTRRADRPRLGPVLLPAEDGVAPGSPAVERYFCVFTGRIENPARQHQGHGADRDRRRGVRDGRDSLRAARALRRLNIGRWITSFRASRNSVPTRSSASPTARKSR